MSMLDARPRTLTSGAQENISNKIGLILSFSLIVIWGARMPVVSRPLALLMDCICSSCDVDGAQVRIGRIAGQYAKPRSSPTEKIGDRVVMSFR